MAQFKDKRKKLDFIPICPLFDAGRQCTRGARCRYRHEINRLTNSHGRSGLESPFTVEVIAREGNRGPLPPPEDQSVKTLYIRRLNSSVLEQDIRDHFCPFGEIESIVIFPHRGGTCAFLTYTTRLAAEMAMLELSSWTDINGQRLKLLWGPPQEWQHKMTGAAISSTQEVGGSSSSTADDLVTTLGYSLENL
ncbi:unnamed protein product [Arabidopsis halleri]